MCGRQSGGALASPIQTFECEEYLCFPKYCKGHDIGKTSHPTFVLVCEMCIKVKQYAYRQAIQFLKIYAFGCMWYHKKHISVRGPSIFLLSLVIFQGRCGFT